MTIASLQNRTSSTKKSLLFTGIFAAVATLIYLFAILPVEDDLVREQKTLTALQNDLQNKKACLQAAAGAEKRHEELTEKLRPFRKALLERTLASYAESARQILDPLALGAGLTDVFYTEEGARPRALPVPKGPLPRQLYARQAIRVTALGSYQSAISFLLRVEKELPLVSLQSMNIAVRTTSKTEQTVEFVLEWPVKGKVTRK